MSFNDHTMISPNMVLTDSCSKPQTHQDISQCSECSHEHILVILQYYSFNYCSMIFVNASHIYICTMELHIITTYVPLHYITYCSVRIHVTHHYIMQERIAYSKTLKGRYFDLVGHFFSVYCVYKIFIVSEDHVMLLLDHVTP